MRARSRSRSPRGYLSVRRSPELLEATPTRSVSPSRESIQAAAREAAEQAIQLAESAESADSADGRKSPASHTGHSTRSTPDVKSQQNGGSNPPPTSNSAIQNLLAGLAAGAAGNPGCNPMQQMLGLQNPQMLAAFATLAAMANNPSPPPPPVSTAGLTAGLPGLFPAMGDQAQALQTFAQLQSLFMPNPAAAAQMMGMQQVRDTFPTVYKLKYFW